MLSRTTRRLSEAEPRGVRRAPLLDFRARPRAKEDAAHGALEVIDSEVRRAWKLISCSGPPCCPNTWLIEAEPDSFIYVESWRWLKEPADQRFPGTHVTIERLPLSGGILAARTSGPAISVPDATDEMRCWWTWKKDECAILSRSDMRPEFLKAAGLMAPH